MKVMSLNTHSWLEENPLDNLKEIAHLIMKEQIDIIALQEVNQELSGKEVDPGPLYLSYESDFPIKETNYALLLVAYLKEQGLDYYWSWTFSHIGYGIYEEGSAILSKVPFQAETLLVSPTKDIADYHTRQILFAHLEEKPLTVGSCHFSWFSPNSEEGFTFEWQQLTETVAKIEHQVLLLGDFNSPAHIKEEGYDLITRTFSDMYELASEKTGSYTVDEDIDGWEDNQEKLRIDFGFVSQPVKVKSYQVVFNGVKGPIVSDHFGIMFEMES